MASKRSFSPRAANSLMPIALGLPRTVGAAPLPRRMAWLTGARLILLTLLLLLVSLFYLRGRYDVGSVSIQVALFTLAVSFALAGVYAALLRRGRGLAFVADLQLVLDQVTWTVFVYLSGGAASGATSFYGLTCVVGSILTGMRGASLAAVVGGACYSALALGLYFGLIPLPPDQPPEVYALQPAELKYYVLVNLLVITVVTMLSGYLAERLRITGGQLVEARVRADAAERMAALGRLAAGLAHEIRNPLSSIAGSVGVLRSSPGLDAEDRKLCDIVQREASRLDDLVTDMLDLARPKRPERCLVNLSSLAREVVELAALRGRGGEDVAITLEAPESIHVDADGSQLRQLIWNLVRNAVEASHPGDEVRVVVSVNDAGVRLDVIDHGKGIDEEARQRLFDAFFTTRSKGTGVGLAVVKRIADDHGFELEVASEEGRGATFSVLFGAARVPFEGDSQG